MSAQVLKFRADRKSLTEKSKQVLPLELGRSQIRLNLVSYSMSVLIGSSA